MKFKEALEKFWEGSFYYLDFQFMVMPILLGIVIGGIGTIVIIVEQQMNPYNAFWLMPLLSILWSLCLLAITNVRGGCM